MNSLSEKLFNKKVLPYHQAPARYSGELFGIQYLYNQSSPEFSPECDEGDEDDDDIDEGLGDDSNIFPPLSISEDLATFTSLAEDNEVCVLHQMCVEDLSSCVTCVTGYSGESYR